MALVALGAAGGGAWILSLPPAPAVADPPPISKEEADATLMALKPPKRQRPLIAIIGINDATEVTDYLMPYRHPSTLGRGRRGDCWRRSRGR